MAELDVLLELGEEYVRTIFLEKRHKQLIPTYHLIGADDSHHVIGTPWENELQKQLSLAAVREEARKIKCRAFCVVSEGWAVVVDKDQDYHSVPKPSVNPDRIEVVHISAATTEGAASIMLHMVRDLSPGMNNRVIALEPMQRFDDRIEGQVNKGRMVEGLIQPK
jgi:hypothetical protein